ncbi:MAG: UbiH/UbiF family hydroxylase [Herminiimonas sp.]|nr:UbiH/UbiF family hydroxylase [Herminiimonas sp.]
MQLQSDVCIIGNGAIGKTAALGLAQAGLSVTLLCPEGIKPSGVMSPEAWDVRVYALNHDARALLSSMKVWDALDASRVTPIDAMEVHGDGTDNPGKLAFDAFGARVGALAWIVEDRNLNQALDAALKFASNVRVVGGVAAAMQVSEKSVAITLASGESITASLLVGADGGQSWVRSQCGIDISYRPYAQNAIVANFSCEKPHHGVAFQWFTSAQGILALLPLPGNNVSMVWSAPHALADILINESPAQLAQRVSVLALESLGQLQAPTGDIKSFPLSLIRAQAITAPRVALVGDAAHVIHPLAGHGMNLGFADVAGLLATVTQRSAHQDCGDAKVLRRYARSRKEDILLMQVATDGLERLFAADFEPLRVARNIGLNLLDKLPVIKRQLMAHALGKRS